MRIAVLGGGPGGYAAAFEAARLGAEPVLVERDRLGGTCLNWGCIPTKTILRTAHIALDTRRADAFGLHVAPARVDVDALRQRKDAVVADLVSQIESVAARLKVRVVHGEGRLAQPHALEVTGADGSVERIEADAVILATGSEAFKLPGIDHTIPGVWTSDDAVALREIPGSIVIVGGGVIGLEFACAYAAFGTRVTIVELMEQVLPGMDRRIAREAQRALEALGVRFVLGDAVEAVERLEDGCEARLRSGDVLRSDVVMSAVGRVPGRRALQHLAAARFCLHGVIGGGLVLLASRRSASPSSDARSSSTSTCARVFLASTRSAISSAA